MVIIELDLGLGPGLALRLLELSNEGVLLFREARPEGAGLTANSWAPGVGGGRKDEEGDGNGEAVLEPSRDMDR